MNTPEDFNTGAALLVILACAASWFIGAIYGAYLMLKLDSGGPLRDNRPKIVDFTIRQEQGASSLAGSGAIPKTL